jgi:hypothetical protein
MNEGRETVLDNVRRDNKRRRRKGRRIPTTTSSSTSTTARAQTQPILTWEYFLLCHYTVPAAADFVAVGIIFLSVILWFLSTWSFSCLFESKNFPHELQRDIFSTTRLLSPSPLPSPYFFSYLGHTSALIINIDNNWFEVIRF